MQVFIKRAQTLAMVSIFSATQLLWADVATFSADRESGQNLATPTFFSTPGATGGAADVAKAMSASAEFSYTRVKDVTIGVMDKGQKMTTQQLAGLIQAKLDKVFVGVSLLDSGAGEFTWMASWGSHHVQISVDFQGVSPRVTVSASAYFLGVAAQAMVLQALGDLSAYQELSLPFIPSTAEQREHNRQAKRNPEFLHTANVTVTEDIPGLAAVGVEKLKADGSLDVVILNGGMGTRLDPKLPKGLYPLIQKWGGNQDMCMLMLHFYKALQLQQKLGIHVRIHVMTSYQTIEQTYELAKDMGLNLDDVIIYPQGMASRVLVQSEAELVAAAEKWVDKQIAAGVFSGEERAAQIEAFVRNYHQFMSDNGLDFGAAIPDRFGVAGKNPPGHGDTQYSAILAGVWQLMNENGWGRRVVQCNIHHVDLWDHALVPMVGFHQDELGATAHMAHLPGRAGGGLYKDSHPGQSERMVMIDDSEMKHLMRQAEKEAADLEATDPDKAARLKAYAKGLKARLEEAQKNPEGGFNVAAYVYSLDYMLQRLGLSRADLAKDPATLTKSLAQRVAELPSLEDQKVVEIDGTMMAVAQFERQTQSNIDPTQFFVTSKDPYTSEVKEKKDVAAGLPAILLSTMDAMPVNFLGALQGVDAERVAELNGWIGAAYKAMIAIALASDNPDVHLVWDMKALSNVQALSATLIPLALWVLPYIADVVNQAAGRSFQFSIVTAPGAAAKVEAQMNALFGELFGERSLRFSCVERVPDAASMVVEGAEGLTFEAISQALVSREKWASLYQTYPALSSGLVSDVLRSEQSWATQLSKVVGTAVSWDQFGESFSLLAMDPRQQAAVAHGDEADLDVSAYVARNAFDPALNAALQQKAIVLQYRDQGMVSESGQALPLLANWWEVDKGVVAVAEPTWSATLGANPEVREMLIANELYQLALKEVYRGFNAQNIELTSLFLLLKNYGPEAFAVYRDAIAAYLNGHPLRAQLVGYLEILNALLATHEAIELNYTANAGLLPALSVQGAEQLNAAVRAHYETIVSA